MPEAPLLAEWSYCVLPSDVVAEAVLLLVEVVEIVVLLVEVVKLAAVML